MDALSYQSIGMGAFALIVARAFYVRVKKAPEGNEAMARIARYIREGAMAFLAREYKVLAIYAAVVFALLSATLGRARRRCVLRRCLPVAHRRLLRHEGCDLRERPHGRGRARARQGRRRSSPRSTAER